MILDSFLTKIGVSSYDDLTPEEKETYRSWKETLTGRKLTDEEVYNFIDAQIENCVEKLTTLKLNDRDDIFIKSKLDLLRTLKNFLDSPKLEKEVITRQIKSQL